MPLSSSLSNTKIITYYDINNALNSLGGGTTKGYASLSNKYQCVTDSVSKTSNLLYNNYWYAYYSHNNTYKLVKNNQITVYSRYPDYNNYIFAINKSSCAIPASAPTQGTSGYYATHMIYSTNVMSNTLTSNAISVMTSTGSVSSASSRTETNSKYFIHPNVCSDGYGNHKTSSSSSDFYTYWNLDFIGLYGCSFCAYFIRTTPHYVYVRSKSSITSNTSMSTLYSYDTYNSSYSRRILANGATSDNLRYARLVYMINNMLDTYYSNFDKFTIKRNDKSNISYSGVSSYTYNSENYYSSIMDFGIAADHYVMSKKIEIDTTWENSIHQGKYGAILETIIDAIYYEESGSHYITANGSNLLDDIDNYYYNYGLSYYSSGYYVLKPGSIFCNQYSGYDTVKKYGNDSYFESILFPKITNDEYDTIINNYMISNPLILEYFIAVDSSSYYVSNLYNEVSSYLWFNSFSGLTGYPYAARNTSSGIISETLELSSGKIMIIPLCSIIIDLSTITYSHDVPQGLILGQNAGVTIQGDGLHYNTTVTLPSEYTSLKSSNPYSAYQSQYEYLKYLWFSISDGYNTQSNYVRFFLNPNDY